MFHNHISLLKALSWERDVSDCTTIAPPVAKHTIMEAATTSADVSDAVWLLVPTQTLSLP